MSFNFRDVPIVIDILAHTGREDGDDAGYRDVTVSPLDSGETADPMISLDGCIECVPAHAIGWVPGLLYNARIPEAEHVLFLREPAARALEDADDVLARYNRRLVVVDAFRPMTVQAGLWRSIFNEHGGITTQQAAIMNYGNLSMSQVVRHGCKADVIAAYCRITRTPATWALLDEAVRKFSTLDEAARDRLGFSSIEEYCWRYVTYMQNLLGNAEVFDTTSVTAHGGGGAVDVYMEDTETNKFTCLGVPYTYTGAASRMNYFEHEENRERFLKEMRNDPTGNLLRYLEDCGMLDPHDGLRDNAWETIQYERRILYHAMREIGGTFYIEEPWHWNLGNERGGKLATALPGAGSGCHSLLKNICDPSSGQWLACWGNDEAHKQYRRTR